MLRIGGRIVADKFHAAIPSWRLLFIPCLVLEVAAQHLRAATSAAISKI